MIPLLVLLVRISGSLTVFGSIEFSTPEPVQPPPANVCTALSADVGVPADLEQDGWHDGDGLACGSSELNR